MGRTSAASGSVGESHANGLLSRLFISCHQTQGGDPVDWACKELRVEPFGDDLYRDPTLYFQIQVKAHRRFRRRPEIARETFDHWVVSCETQPVFVITVREVNAVRQEYSFLCFHDWLLTQEAAQALCGRGSANLSLAGFRIVDDDAGNFHDALKAEADRALQDSEAPWATLRDFGLFPFNEAQFFMYMEFVPFAELPSTVRHAVSSRGSGSIPMLVRDAIRTGGSGNPELVEWVEQLRRMAPPQGASSFQRRQFQHFVNAMSSYQKKLPCLPSFRIAEVSTWRAFVSMYPNSVLMLEQVIRHSKNPRDLMFASAMLPMLANSSDRRLQRKSRDAVAQLIKRRELSDQYAFCRELYRGPAEAGDSASLKKAKAFLKKRNRHAPVTELEFLEEYGWTLGTVAKNIERKLTAPSVRDLPLQDFYSTMGEITLGVIP